MKKFVLCLVCFSSLFADLEKIEDKRCRTTTASAIAWGSLGISLLVVVGVIVAISLNKNHN